MNSIASAFQRRAGAHRSARNTLRLYRIAPPASAIVSEHAAAFWNVPAVAGPPLNAATHSGGASLRGRASAKSNPLRAGPD